MKEQKTQRLEVCHDAVPPILETEGDDHDREPSLQVNRSGPGARPGTHGTIHAAQFHKNHFNNNGVRAVNIHVA